MHHPTDRITHTMAFVTPVVEHWLEPEIAQWVSGMAPRDLLHAPSQKEDNTYNNLLFFYTSCEALVRTKQYSISHSVNYIVNLPLFGGLSLKITGDQNKTKTTLNQHPHLLLAPILVIDNDHNYFNCHAMHFV